MSHSVNDLLPFVDGQDAQRPAEWFFDPTGKDPLTNIGGCEVVCQLHFDHEGFSRCAGVRLRSCTGVVVDVLVPDSSIVNVQAYNDGKAPAPDLKCYPNSRSIVGDSYHDLCATLYNGIFWEGRRIFRYTDVTVAQHDGRTVELVTFNPRGPVLRVLIGLYPFFELEIYSNVNVHGPLSPGYYRPNWVLVSKDIGISRRLAATYSDGEDKEEHSTIWTRQSRPGCKYIGFGEKSGAHLSMKGTYLSFFNSDNYAYRMGYNKPYGFSGGGTEPEPLYHSNPMWLEVVASHPTVGVFLDTVAPSFIDLNTVNSGSIQIGTLLSRFSYYVVVQQSSYDVLRMYYRLVGSGHLFPKWVLGYMQGKYGWRNKGEVITCAQKFKDYGIPMDGFNIDIDIQENFQLFTVNPDFDGVFQELLKSFNIKSSTNITPFVEKSHPLLIPSMMVPDFHAGESGHPPTPSKSMWTSKIPYEGGIEGHWPDFGDKRVGRWWGTLYRSLIEKGLSFVWQDMVTPDVLEIPWWRSFPYGLLIADNTMKQLKAVAVSNPGRIPRTIAIAMRNQYALNLIKNTYYGWLHCDLFPDKRPFIIGRGGCSGMHRFGGLWTGDNVSTWEFLATNVAQCLSLGMSGQFMAGADIGGFGMSNDANNQQRRWVDPVLITRWHLASTFLPWFRNHYDGHWSRNSDRTYKDLEGKFFQEIWAYPENKFRVPADLWPLYENVVPVCKYFIELRYMLVQLLYDAMHNSVRTGLPIIRPMFIQDRTLDPMLADEQFSFNNNQFFVGNDMLVAPILTDSTDGKIGTRDVYLPLGSTWYMLSNIFCPLNRECDKVTRVNISGHLPSGHPECRNPKFMPLHSCDPVEGGKIVKGYKSNLANVADCPDDIPYHLPIWIRAGAIIPVVEPSMTITNGGDGPVTLHVFPGVPPLGLARYDLFLDDDSRSSCPVRGEFDKHFGSQDKFKHISVRSWVNTSNDHVLTMRTVRLTCSHNLRPDDARWLVIAFIHDEQHKSLLNRYALEVTGTGDKVFAATEVSKTTEFFSKPKTGCFFTVDDSLRVTYVRIPCSGVLEKKGDKLWVRLVLCQLPVFDKPKVLADNLHDGYWITSADLRGVGRPDIIAYGLQRGEMMLYQNNGGGEWSKKSTLIHQLEGAVATDHFDITGNGRQDLVTCYMYGPSMITPDPNGGMISWLENPGREAIERGDQWKDHYIGKCISMHRLRVGHFNDANRVQVLGLPIVGAQRDLHKTPVTLCLFTAPSGDIKLANHWDFSEIKIDMGLHIIHEVALEEIADGLQAIVLAASEGLIRVHWEKASGNWVKEILARGDHSRPKEMNFHGCGNVCRCKFNNVQCWATIEPFHGNVVAVYTPSCGKWIRNIVDIYGLPNSLEEGPAHHVIAADIDRDGNDELLVACRGPHPFEGVFAYKCGKDMSLGGLSFTKYQLTSSSAARIAVEDWNGTGNLGFATVGYDVPLYYEDPDSQVLVVSNTGKIDTQSSLHPLPCVTRHSHFVELTTDTATPGEFVLRFEPCTHQKAVCSERFVMSYDKNPVYSLQFFILAPSTSVFLPGIADGQCSYLKQILGNLLVPNQPLLLHHDGPHTRNIQLCESYVESGQEGSLFAVFTKLPTAPTVIADPTLLSWERDGNSVMPFCPYPNVSGLFNSRYIRVTVGNLLVCSVQFWAAGFGVDCGIHNHSDLTAANTFCEVHVGLYNGSGLGGMTVVHGEATPHEEHFPVCEGEEHKPLWEQVKFEDRAKPVRYPMHKWICGARPDGVSEQRCDVWAAFEHRPAPLYDSLEVKPEEAEERAIVPPAPPARRHNRCICNSVACML